MTRADIDALANTGVLLGKPLLGSVVETHISWVILSAAVAVKIKKPLQLSFLDFSTLARRKECCERELALNRRFSDIYLSVQPISSSHGVWNIGGDPAEVVEYCVVMKRLSTDDRMDNRARNSDIREEEVRMLAKKVAAFHGQAPTVHIPFDLPTARDMFNDISSIGSVISGVADNDLSRLICLAIGWSDDFLEQHQRRLQQRIDLGFKRDVHGDLHMGMFFWE